MIKVLFILFLFPLFANTQTRLYLTQIASNFAPTVNAAWNVTTGNTVNVLMPYVDNASAITITSGATGAAAVRKILLAQYVSPPLIAQTINGTCTGQIRMGMSSVTSRTGEGFVYLRILNNDGTVASEVGSLTTTALTTTNVNRTLIALTLSSVTVTGGQRLCLDIGWNYSTGSNTATTGSMIIRTTRTTGDLPVDNTSTAGSNPWFEFSQTLKFQYQSNIF